MHISFNRSVSVIAALAVLATISGCATNRSKSDTAYIARDVDTLYATAKDKLDRNQYKLAAALFDELRKPGSNASIVDPG